MPEFRFYHSIEVRYGDLDPQGHLNNAKYLTYFEQARIQYFVELGLFSKGQSFMDIGVILAEARVAFHAPVHFGDPVKVGVRVTKIGNKSMSVEQAILHEVSGARLATGQVTLVAFDYQTNQTTPVPQQMREKIEKFERLSQKELSNEDNTCLDSYRS